MRLGDLFAPLGAPCGARDDGDPVVVYDQLADRWLITQFCLAETSNYHQLIAISKTGDPTGAYYLYDFVMPSGKFNDYPHFGVWPDAYYMTDSQFDQSTDTFVQSGVFAFNRVKMLVGDPAANYIYFDTAALFPPGAAGSANGPFGIAGILPADLDGFAPPPAGAPCPFAYFQAAEFNEPGDRLRIFNFHADFATAGQLDLHRTSGQPAQCGGVRPDDRLEESFPRRFTADVCYLRSRPDPGPAHVPAGLSELRLERVPDRDSHRECGGKPSVSCRSALLPPDPRYSRFGLYNRRATDLRRTRRGYSASLDGKRRAELPGRSRIRLQRLEHIRLPVDPLRGEVKTDPAGSAWRRASRRSSQVRARNEARQDAGVITAT